MGHINYKSIHSLTQSTNTNTILLPPQVGIENKVMNHHRVISYSDALIFDSL